jgi:hypothetical protein
VPARPKPKHRHPSTRKRARCIAAAPSPHLPTPTLDRFLTLPLAAFNDLLRLSVRALPPEALDPRFRTLCAQKNSGSAIPHFPRAHGAFETAAARARDTARLSNPHHFPSCCAFAVPIATLWTNRRSSRLPPCSPQSRTFSVLAPFAFSDSHSPSAASLLDPATNGLKSWQNASSTQ